MAEAAEEPWSAPANGLDGPGISPAAHEVIQQAAGDAVESHMGPAARDLTVNLGGSVEVRLNWADAAAETEIEEHQIWGQGVASMGPSGAAGNDGSDDGEDCQRDGLLALGSADAGSEEEDGAEAEGNALDAICDAEEEEEEEAEADDGNDADGDGDEEGDECDFG